MDGRGAAANGRLRDVTRSPMPGPPATQGTPGEQMVLAGKPTLCGLSATGVSKAPNLRASRRTNRARNCEAEAPISPRKQGAAHRLGLLLDHSE